MRRIAFAVSLAVSVTSAGCAIYVDDPDPDPGPGPGPGPDPEPEPDPEALEPVATGHPDVWEMAADATHVYWVEAGQLDERGDLRRMARGGGTVETLASIDGRTYALALGDTDVFLAQTFGGNGGYQGSVVRVAKTGGDPVVLTEGFNPTSVTVDGAWVYYSLARSPDGSIWRVAADGGTPELVVDDVDNPWDLVAADGDLYYSEMNRGRMMRVTPGAAPVVLADGWIGTLWMDVDATHVYFGACATGECATPTLYRVPRAGGALETLGALSDGPHDGKIAVDGDRVVWGDRLLSDGAFTKLIPGRGLGATVIDGEVYVADFDSGDVYLLTP